MTERARPPGETRGALPAGGTEGTSTVEDLYIVAREPGLEGSLLPTWTDRGGKAISFADDPPLARRVAVPDVPGAFQLLDVLTGEEADAFVRITEELGYHQDSPVSLPHSVRHNENLNWVVSETIDATIWSRSAHLVTERVAGQSARGLNARFRFYRYGPGDYFKPHSDGAWTGSRVIGEQLFVNAYPDLISRFTYLIFLTEGYGGGRTQFLVSRSDPGQPARWADDAHTVSVATPKGGVLCFPHGAHPQQCLHASEAITKGVKVIIRTDILYG